MATLSFKQYDNFLLIVPQSIEPSSVNTPQKPVFSIRVQNTAPFDIEITENTTLKLANYAVAPPQTISSSLEKGLIIAAGQEVVLRFRPMILSSVIMNSLPYPVRIEFEIIDQGTISRFTAFSRMNIVSVSGNGGIMPIESIGVGIPPGITIICSRSGGFYQFPIVMMDMFPVDIDVTWCDPAVGWTVESDSGIDLVANRSRTLPQVRAWTVTGFSLTPDESVPANTIIIVGTIKAIRCPVMRDGLGACIGVGSAIRAVVAESAEVTMSPPIGSVPQVAPGTSLTVKSSIINPYAYSVDLTNYNSTRQPGVDSDESSLPSSVAQFEVPAQDAVESFNDVGVRVLRDGVEVRNTIVFESLLGPDYLRPNTTSEIGWRCKFKPNTPRGVYLLQPFASTTVWLSGPPGLHSSIKYKLDPGVSDPNFGVTVEVV